MNWEGSFKFVTPRPAPASGTRSSIGCSLTITQNWRGHPLVSREVVVNLVGDTTVADGLRISAQLDDREYPAGIKVSDQALAELAIARDEFHSEWNYRIKPHLPNG